MMAMLQRDAERADSGAPVPMLPRRAATVPAPREATISPPALRRLRSEPAHSSRRMPPESMVAHRSTIVCEQVPWRVAEEALRAAPDDAQLHLPSLLHYPSSAPLMPLVLCERIDDVSIDRLHTLGLLPHMARLCAVARHPVDQKSALFFGWPELGTFADADASGPWFARHPWQTLLTVLYGVAVGLCALHGAGEAHGAVTPAAVGVRHDGSAWLLPCGSLHVRPSSGSATLGEKALARDADLRGVGRLLHELGSAGASAPPAVSVALLELAPRCEALELTMHEVAAKLADVFRMSVLDSSTAPAGDLPPATQRWSRLRVLITAASAFTEAAATRALCLICLEEVSTRRGLACPEGHLICSACLQGYICSLAGSAKLRSSNGALDCLGEHQQPFSFCSSMVEPLLFGDGLRLYLETMETTETPDEGEFNTPESIQPELHKALNLSCPSCGVFCDPDPDGCIAMTCSSCHVAFCWLCFQACGRDAHPHCHVEHGGYFPPRSDVDRWTRRLRWRQVDGVLQRSFGGRRLPEREEALRLCERNLADSKIGLWPFPNVQPSVGGMLGALPHVQSAQFGQIDELRALLDETPELIDRADGRGMTALMAAAHGGHAAVVTELLERGADVTCRDDRGVSALDYAIREDRQKVVLAILAHEGQVVNAVGPSGKTALMVAAETGHDSCALVLLEAKADPNQAQPDGWTALMLAAHYGHTQVVLVLLEAKADPNQARPDGWTALMLAALKGHEQVALVLLEAKADPNQGMPDGVTALMAAAQNGHEQVALVLLEAKADPNQAKPNGVTALICAAQNGHEQVALVLLEAKADPKQAKSDGGTALMLAALKGHEQVALVLLEAKADPNQARPDGWTALMLAALKGHEQVALVLLEAKADPNQGMPDGVTALMAAAQNGHEQVALVLLEAKADPNQAKPNGETALICAAQNGHEQVALVLLEAKADPNQAKHDGWTALMLAAHYGDEQVALVLLEAKADPNQAKSDGWTALMIAAENGHEPCARVLLEAGTTLLTASVPLSATLITGFSTIGVQVAAAPVKAFYEIELIAIGGAQQLGWASPSFLVGASAPLGEGVGDDDVSWGADGARKLLWHAGESQWEEQWAAGDVIGLGSDLTTGTIWFGKNGVWKAIFSDVRADSLYPALTGNGLACCIRLGAECMLSPPDEGFVPYPQGAIELLRGRAGALISASEVPPSVRTQGIDVWLMARGSGSDACAQLIAGWASRHRETDS